MLSKCNASNYEYGYDRHAQQKSCTAASRHPDRLRSIRIRKTSGVFLVFRLNHFGLPPPEVVSSYNSICDK